MCVRVCVCVGPHLVWPEFGRLSRSVQEWEGTHHYYVEHENQPRDSDKPML